MSKRYDPRDFTKIWVISDLHSIYLDHKAFKVFLQAYQENEADALILNGDILDFPMLMSDSKHKLLPGEERLSFLEECDYAVENILKPLRKAHGKNMVIFKPGNHEDRAIRILLGNLPGLQQLVEASSKRGTMHLDDLLRFDELDIEMSRGEKRNGRDTDVNFIRKMGGGAAVLHGTAANKQRLQAYLRYFLCSGTSGHTHKMDSERLPWYGGVFTWVESGCLCRLNAVEYLPIGKDPGWQHGFATIWISKTNGEVFVKGHPIQNYTVEYRGQVFSG